MIARVRLLWILLLSNCNQVLSMQLAARELPQEREKSPEIADVKNVEVSTLNFNFHNKVISGKDGTIAVWAPSKKLNFDVDAIHTILASYTKDDAKKKEPNVAVSAFTVIIQNTDSSSNPKFYAITKIIFKKNTSEVLKWYSGGLSKLPTENRCRFFSNLENRIRALKKSYDPSNSVVKLINKIEAHQRPFHDKLLKSINTVIERNKRGTDNESIFFDHFWAELEATKEKAAKIEKPEGGEVVKEPKASAGEIGPFTDSEQFLLSYLEDNFISKSSIEGLTDPTSYRGDFYELLSALATDNNKSEMREELFKFAASQDKDLGSISDDSIVMIRKLLQEYTQFFSAAENGKLMGCILHVHSTNEPCEFCSASLVCETHKKPHDDNFVNRCKKFMTRSDPEAKPFFVTLFSYSNLIGGKNEWRLPGTISGGKNTEVKNIGDKKARGENIRDPNGDEIDTQKRLDLQKIVERGLLPILQIQEVPSDMYKLSSLAVVI